MNPVKMMINAYARTHMRTHVEVIAKSHGIHKIHVIYK